MAHVCSQLSSPVSHWQVEELHLDHLACSWEPKLEWQRDMKSTQRLTLFRPFHAVRDLYVSEGLVPFVIPALQRPTDERTTEVFPALRRLVLVSEIRSFQTWTRRRRAICESEAALESPSDCPDSIETAILNRRLIHGHVRHQ